MSARNGERHSSDKRAGRSDVNERLFERRDGFLIGRTIMAHRRDNPVRTSAGICPSCDCPIDAVTSECGCSA